MAVDQVIYIDSARCTNVYPNNTPSSFENRIVPLYLDPGKTYECNLKNLVHPRRFTLLSGEEGYQIRCITSGNINTNKIRSSAGTLTDSTKMFTGLGRKIRSCDLNAVCGELNRSLWTSLKKSIGTNRKQVLRKEMGMSPYDNFMEMEDGDFLKFYTQYTYDRPGKFKVFKYLLRLDVKFTPTLSKLLGFPPDTYLNIYQHNPDLKHKVAKISEIYTPKELKRSYVTYICIDIIDKVRYADTLCHILNMAELPMNDVALYTPPEMYIPVTKMNIESMAVRLIGQDGQDVPFALEDEGGLTSTTVCVHIKERKP